MLIRSETAADEDAIRDVNVEAFRVHPFSRQTEHLIVGALRDAGALDVSLVAEADGVVIGHIAFSAATIGTEEGWSLLGPVAVLPRWQREGVGSKLVEAGLREIRKRGSLGCVLVGDPGFYARFGFRQVPGVRYAGVPDEYVLVLPFGTNLPAGVVHAHAAFSVGLAGG
jgi:putative acetyltransferase